MRSSSEGHRSHRPHPVTVSPQGNGRRRNRLHTTTLFGPPQVARSRLLLLAKSPQFVYVCLSTTISYNTLNQESSVHLKVLMDSGLVCAWFIAVCLNTKKKHF